MRLSTRFLNALASVSLIVPATSLAGVTVLSQSARIHSFASYYCGETDNDSVEDEATFTDLAGLEQSRASTLLGSCGSGNSEAGITITFLADGITIQGDVSAGASRTDFDLGGYGRASYEFEIVFRLDAPTSCMVGANSFGGGQGSSGGSSYAEFRGADGAVYMSEDLPLSFIGGEVELSLSLPNGDYTMIGEGSFSASEDGGGGSGTHYIRFLDTVATGVTTVSTVKARY